MKAIKLLRALACLGLLFTIVLIYFNIDRSELTTVIHIAIWVFILFMCFCSWVNPKAVQPIECPGKCII